MKKIINTVIIFAALTALIGMSIYLDVPNYITYYTRPDNTTTVSTLEHKDYSKSTGLINYILEKNDDKWESLVPDAFYQGLSGEKVIKITINKTGEKSVTYEYNSFMGVLKMGDKCLYLSSGDKVVLNLLFE